VGQEAHIAADREVGATFPNGSFSRGQSTRCRIEGDAAKKRELSAAGRFGSELHRAGFFFGNLPGKLSGFLGAFEGLTGQFIVCGMIARAVTARGNCVGMRCVVVEFSGLRMFALGHGPLLFRQPLLPPV
jgi:hypothetical protein